MARQGEATYGSITSYQDNTSSKIKRRLIWECLFKVTQQTQTERRSPQASVADDGYRELGPTNFRTDPRGNPIQLSMGGTLVKDTMSHLQLPVEATPKGPPWMLTTSGLTPNAYDIGQGTENYKGTWPVRRIISPSTSNMAPPTIYYGRRCSGKKAP